MGRYIGPKHKKCRRLGVKVCDSDKCPMMVRNYPPGMHGIKGRAKLTGYGEQLAQKQIARTVYGILERQFRKYYDTAIRQGGDASEKMVQQLETRFDNVVFRLGFAKTRRQARQFTTHALFTINGQRVDVPSYQLKPGDVVALKEKSKKSKAFENIGEKLKSNELPSWLNVNEKELSGKVLDLPTLKDLQLPFDPKTIIEFYSK